MDSDPAQERFDRLAALHKDRFKKAFYDALGDLHTFYVQTSHLYRPGEKAALMHVHVRDRMKQAFDGVPGVRVDDRPGRAFKVHLDGAPYSIPALAEFKCKKFTPSLLTSRILTQSVKRFEKGLPEWTPGIQVSLFPGMEPKTVEGPVGHGNAGYVINALWTEFERLCITFYTDVHAARLAVEIPLGGDGDSGTVINLPLGDINEVTERKRVKPRKKKEEVSEPDARPKKRIKLEAVKPEEETRKKARNNGEDS